MVVIGRRTVWSVALVSGSASTGSSSKVSTTTAEDRGRVSVRVRVRLRRGRRRRGWQRRESHGGEGFAGIASAAEK